MDVRMARSVVGTTLGGSSVVSAGCVSPALIWPSSLAPNFECIHTSGLVSRVLRSSMKGDIAIEYREF